MRFLLALVGLAALVVVALVALGMLQIGATPGQLPSVSVNGGAAPQVTANMATIHVGTTTKTVEVPTMTTTTRTVEVPTLTVNKPVGADGNSVTTR